VYKWAQLEEQNTCPEKHPREDAMYARGCCGHPSKHPCALRFSSGNNRIRLSSSLSERTCRQTRVGINFGG
jgi:hypothetical protein